MGNEFQAFLVHHHVLGRRGKVFARNRAHIHRDILRRTQSLNGHVALDIRRMGRVGEAYRSANRSSERRHFADFTHRSPLFSSLPIMADLETK